MDDAAQQHDETLDFADYNQCQEAVKRLTEYLSQELNPDEEEAVQRHLRQCKGCFAKFQFEENLLRTIREKAQQVRAPGSLRERILGLLDRKEPVGAGSENSAR